MEGFPGGQAATAAVTWIGAEVQVCRKRWRCATEVVLDSTWSPYSFGASLPRNAELLRTGRHSESAPPFRREPDEWGALTMRDLTRRVGLREYADDYGIGLP